MSIRTNQLLEDLQDVFGESFGIALSEGPKPKGRMFGQQQPGGGRAKGKKGGDFQRPGRKRREFDRRSAKSIQKKAAAAARKNPKNKEKQKSDEKAYQDAIADIRGRVAKSAEKSKAKKAGGREKGVAGGATGGKAGGEKRGKEKSGAGSAGGRHHPFKRSANLGPGPRDRHHDETKCWKCSCPDGSYYPNKCTCRSTGKGKNCPPAGRVKKITIQKGYKKRYNDEYHAWRARQGGAVTARLGSARR